MTPIPLSLLGDTALIYPEDASSAYGSRYLDPVIYKNVRLDTSVAAMEKTWADEDGIDAVLFIDAVNSSPAQRPELRSKVEVVRSGGTWSGLVRSVRELIGPGSEIHHWEVGLGI